METEMDRLASNRMWNHITRMRVGGKVRNSNALVLLEVTAAKI
jgi:predicted phage gp36 major capsid-like protein